MARNCTFKNDFVKTKGQKLCKVSEEQKAQPEVSEEKRTFKKAKMLFASVLGAAMTITPAATAQDKFTANGNIDLTSNYVWRGMDQNAGFSVQPTLSLSCKGLSLTAWGSQSITNNADRDVQELDISLSYSVGGLTATLTDYWWGGLHNPYGYYKQGPAANPIDGGHHLEATIACQVSEKIPLTISWSTWIAGADVRTDSGRRCLSTYVNAAYDIACPAQVTLTPSVGFTPWKGYYHDKAAVTDLSLKAQKRIDLSGKIFMPIFVQAVASPTHDHVYLVAGMGLGF